MDHKQKTQSFNRSDKYKGRSCLYSKRSPTEMRIRHDPVTMKANCTRTGHNKLKRTDGKYKHYTICFG